MARFCTKCGRPLTEGEKCDCQPQTTGSTAVEKGKSFLVKLLERMGLGAPGANSASLVEAGQAIVPDITKPNDGEVPIKQYEAATLRSRIRGQYAKGRLQITNKRLLFRAAGISYKGPVAQQYEFAVDEIAGVEIKKANRLSPLNIILCFWLNGLIAPIFNNIFQAFAAKTPTFALLTSIVLGLGAMMPFFMLRKKFWLKFLILCCGIGILSGTGELANLSAYSFLTGININIADFVSVILLIVWALNVILVSLVPDLILCIKTKGATEAIHIRRKQHTTLFKQEVEYTGFSEVIPGKDIDAIISEVGAIVDDIQTLGDVAIEKWQQNK